MLKFAAAAIAIFMASLSTSTAFAQTSFESAKTSYLGLHRAAESQVASIEADSRAALGPIDEQIKTAVKDRTNCDSFACAEKLTSKIDDLQKQYDDTAAPFSEKENAVRGNLAQAGRELAVDAYAQEVAGILSSIPDVKVLSAVHDQPCLATDTLVPGRNSVCKMSIFEFRLGAVFYRTQLAYGLPMLEAALAVASLDELFTGNVDQFLQPGTLDNGESFLRNGIKIDGAHQGVTFNYPSSPRIYDFWGNTHMNYLSVQVQHTP